MPIEGASETGPERQNGLAPPYAAPPIWRPPKNECAGSGCSGATGDTEAGRPTAPTENLAPDGRCRGGRGGPKSALHLDFLPYVTQQLTYHRSVWKLKFTFLYLVLGQIPAELDPKTRSDGSS